MGEHIINGHFQSDKYPTCPAGKVPLSTKDPLAQDLLWEYAQRRKEIDQEFSNDLEECLIADGFNQELLQMDLIKNYDYLTLKGVMLNDC